MDISKYLYYDHDGITIYCGDCREILPHLGPVDLVLTDPPYNVGVYYGIGTNDNRDDFIEWMRPILAQLLDLSKTVLMTTGHYRLPDYAKIAPWRWMICWHKPAAMGRSPVGFSNWEPVVLWGAGGKNAVDYIKAPIIPDKSIDGHPCPKPLMWGKSLLVMFPQANTILDPFMGSGTTLVAAKQLRRKAIGIEIEEKYCEIAKRRLAQEVLDL